MKKRYALSALAIGFTLIGASCTPTPTPANVNVVDCTYTTLWDSCITSNQADTSLLGTWTLTEQQLITPTGTVSNPFNGRTLTFTDNVTYNGYSEDWSPELVSTTVNSPDGAATSECETVGILGGSWAAVVGDSLSDTSNEMQLWIVPEGVGSPTVTCNAGGIDVTSNAASTPLGVGEAKTGPTGDLYVEHTYSISEDGNILVISQEMPSGVTNVFFFERI